MNSRTELMTPTGAKGGGCERAKAKKCVTGLVTCTNIFEMTCRLWEGDMMINQ